MAAAITLLVVCCLIGYALTTKTDFTGCGPYLFTALTILVLCSIFGLTRWLDPDVYAYIGIALFSLYLVYDVQMCASKKLGAQYSVDDYVLAAMNMWEEGRERVMCRYLDIINLFLYILQLLGNRDWIVCWNH